MLEQPFIRATGHDRNGSLAALCSTVVTSLMVYFFLSASIMPALAESPTVSKQAPDFALASSTGSNLRLSEFRGDVVVLNFWSTRCGRCRSQLEWLAEIDEAQLSILSVNIDGDSQAAVREIEDQGYGFPVLFDTDKKVSRLYDPSRLPMTVMIDPHGTVRFIHEGHRRGDEKLYAKTLSKLLAE